MASISPSTIKGSTNALNNIHENESIEISSSAEVVDAGTQKKRMSYANKPLPNVSLGKLMSSPNVLNTQSNPDSSTEFSNSELSLGKPDDQLSNHENEEIEIQALKDEQVFSCPHPESSYKSLSRINLEIIENEETRLLVETIKQQSQILTDSKESSNLKDLSSKMVKSIEKLIELTQIQIDSSYLKSALREFNKIIESTSPDFAALSDKLKYILAVCKVIATGYSLIVEKVRNIVKANLAAI
jgi:hypothetical protein